MPKEHKLSVKVPDALLPGVYANQMIIRHTREEFLIDFVNRFPPESVVSARVIVSPGHLKRMIGALKDNLRRYEASHGPVLRAGKPSGSTDDDGGQALNVGEVGGVGEVAPTPGPTTAPAQQARKQIKTKVPERVLAGVYANQMVVSHSPEEFLIDFINIFPPEGVVTARVFVSPDQVKRMIGTLRGNLGRYETAHGTIIEARVPRPDSYLN
jgi:hypothetical protein